MRGGWAPRTTIPCDNSSCLRSSRLMARLGAGRLVWIALLGATCALAQSPLDSVNSGLPVWLRFSGEERARYEGFLGGAVKPDKDDRFLLQRGWVGQFGNS